MNRRVFRSLGGVSTDRKFFETKSNLVSNNHTTVNIKNMKTNIETNTNSDLNATPTAPGRAAASLKAVVVILSLTALCLSYRAANEAVALYGVLDKVQATLANEQTVQAHATGTQISETKSSVAGL